MGQSISTVDDGSGSIKVECPTYDDDDDTGAAGAAGTGAAATEETYPRKQEKERRHHLDSNRNDDDDDNNNDTGGNETGTARNSNSRNNSSASESLSSSFSSSSSQQGDYQEQHQHHTTANRRNTSISSSIISSCSTTNNRSERNRDNHTSTRNVTATALGTSPSSEREKTQPKQERSALPFCVTVSTPHQWKSAFANVSDEEVHALLGFALCSTHHHHDENDEQDETTKNQLLYETILATAYQIKRYRDFERSMVSDGEETPTWNTNNDNTSRSGTTTTNTNTKKQNMDRLTQEQHEYYNRGTHDSALIQLCVHILELTRQKHTSHRPGKNPKPVRQTTTTGPVVDVSQVRLRLVPGRMKEHIFWEAFFVMLYTQWQAQHWTAVCREAGRVMQKTEDSSSSNPHTPSPNPNGGRRTSTTTTVQQRRERAVVSELVVRNNNLTEENQRLEHYVDKLWTSVQQLQLQQLPQNVATQEQTTTTPAAAVTATIKTTIHEQQQLHKSDEPTNSLSSPRVNNEDQPVNQQKKQNNKQNTGTWIVSKDSLEFLALPAEAKLALRTEKQKRLKKVAEEMNFILDSDTLDATHGQWDCCHSTQYDGGDCEKCQSN